MDAIEKNYYRVLLKDIIERKIDKPIVLSGKYQYDTRYEYATFTHIRILMSGEYTKTRVICDHINVLHDSIDKLYKLGEKDNKKKFYFVGYPVTYTTNGEERAGFRLSEETSFIPFGPLSGRAYIEDAIEKECYSLIDWVNDNISDTDMGIKRKLRRDLR